MHLERLLHLLEIVAVAGRPVSVAEVQRATGLPKPTCYRLIQTLLETKMIDEPSQDGRYVIGERTIRIALIGYSDVDVRRCAGPLMRDAASAFNETIFLARFRDGKVEIIHVETPDDPARAYIHPGLGVRPMHACSCSKAIAAFAKPAFREAILAGGLRAYTENTKTTEADLRREFEEIETRGFADCDQEIDIGIASVAAPVSVGSVGVIFSIGAVGPVRRFGRDARMEVGKKLVALSDKVSGAIQLSNGAEV